MIRALEHIEDVAVNLKSWLFTVATNQAMLLKRRRKVQFCSVDDESEGVSDADPGPSLTAEMHDDAQRLRELLEQLPLAQREGDSSTNVRRQEIPRDCRDAGVPAEHRLGPNARGVEKTARLVGTESQGLRKDRRDIVRRATELLPLPNGGEGWGEGAAFATTSPSPPAPLPQGERGERRRRIMPEELFRLNRPRTNWSSRPCSMPAASWMPSSLRRLSCCCPKTRRPATRFARPSS